MKHNRYTCLYCEGRLTYEEYKYGACFACIDKLSVKQGWKPRGYDSEAWRRVDCAPRWQEYGDPKDMDDEGVVLIMREIARTVDFRDTEFVKSFAHNAYVSHGHRARKIAK